MTAWKLTDLPPAMRKQAEVQLAKKPDNRIARTPADMESHTCHAPVGTEEAAGRFSCVDIRVHQVRDTRTDPDGASLKAAIKTQSNDLTLMPSRSSVGGMKKNIDPKAVVEAYLRTGSAHKAAKEVGCCHQYAYDLLKRQGVDTTQRGRWHDGDIRQLEAVIKSNPHLSYEEIAVIMGRSRSSVELKAERLGLNVHKHRTPLSLLEKLPSIRKKQWDLPEDELAILKGKVSSATKARFAKNGHPRGMLGKTHSDETKKIISTKGTGRRVTTEAKVKQLKTKMERYGRIGNDMSRMNCTWKNGWRDIGGRKVYFRSRWEANYARYLNLLKHSGDIKEWEFEVDTFWFDGVKRGVVSYKPDFKITLCSGDVEYHEVKGWMDSRSKTKLKRMKKYHPAVTLFVIDEAWFKKNAPTLSKIITDWEKGKTASRP